MLSSCTSSPPARDNDEYLRSLFNACDSDSSGFLCRVELRELCSKFGIGTEDADAIFTDLDVDGDGKISFDDFRCGFDDYEKGILSSTTENQGKRDDVKSTASENKDLITEKVKQNRERIRSQTSRLSVDSASSVVQDLLESVKKLQEENKTLAKCWEREKRQHEQHLHQLEEEVDSQVKEVECRVRQKAKEEVEAERQSLREMMKGEMEELHEHLSMFEKVDAWLKTNQNHLDSDKVNEVRAKLEDAVQENRQLKMSLLDTQTNMVLMRSELTQLRTKYEEKCNELVNERERIYDSQHQQDHLSRQLHLLQDANKRLQDTNDTLRDALEVTKRSLSPQSGFPETRSMKNYRMMRGSVVGDYLEDQVKSIRNRIGEQQLDSLSTIDDEISMSKYSSASCPPGIVEEELDSGLSLRTRCDDEFSLPPHYKPTSRSLMSSPELKNKVPIRRSSTVIEQTNNTIYETQESTEENNNNNQQSAGHFPVISEATGPPDRTYKVIFIGDASVGKSTFILRLAKGQFIDQVTTTLGIDFHVKTFNIDDRNVALQLWDTAGQERYRSITKSYFRKADGIMLLYDVANEQSFLNVRDWMSCVEEVASKGVPVAVVANKTDLRPILLSQGKRCVRAEDGYQLCQQFGVAFHEVSCKDGFNVLNSVAMLTSVMTRNEDRLIESAALTLDETSKSKFSCCRK